MVKRSVKNTAITMFTLMIIVFCSACLEKKIQPIKTNQRDIAAVSIEKDPAEISMKAYSVKGLEDEDLFVIKSRAEQNQLQRQLKNPIKVHFSSQTITDN